jgi:hypothetical protein
MLEMLINVLNVHNDVLAYFVDARRPKLATLTAQHDGTLGHVELRVGDATTRNFGAQPFFETECVPEPVDRFTDVLRRPGWVPPPPSVQIG